MSNKQIIRKQFEEVYNKGNLAAIDEYSTPNVAVHEPGVSYSGSDHVKQIVQNMRTAFPDLHMEIDQLIEEGDWIAAKWKASGTHRGPLYGIAPTGKFATIDGLSYYHMTEGRVAEVWLQWDVLKMLREMNVELPIKLETEVAV